MEVSSLVGQGSTFTVTLPLHPTDAQPSFTDEPVRAALFAPEPTDANEDGLSTVLVVEDDLELRSYIRTQLARNYQIITADNGQIGVEQAIERVPDLIVSDVMMPGLDDYQLAERLKTDERTSHIPLILLTAKSAYESRMQGLSSGADDYLSKPFSLAELSLRIGNCLRTRQQWQQWLQPERKLNDPASHLIPRLTKEEHFLNRLRSLILAHLTDELIDVDWLAGQVNMSRTQLHRTLKALTNMSTTRFIHSVCIQKAVDLLR